MCVRRENASNRKVSRVETSDSSPDPKMQVAWFEISMQMNGNYTPLPMTIIVRDLFTDVKWSGVITIDSAGNGK